MSINIASLSIKHFKERNLVIKRAHFATNYFEYVTELDCEVWNTLLSLSQHAMDVPKGIWLSDDYIDPGTSKYVQGIELPYGYECEIPEGFDVLYIPESTFFVFKSEPFNDEDFMTVVDEMHNYINNIFKYDESVYEITHWPYDYQLEPLGSTGYTVGIGIKYKED